MATQFDDVSAVACLAFRLRTGLADLWAWGAKGVEVQRGQGKRVPLEPSRRARRSTRRPR